MADYALPVLTSNYSDMVTMLKARDTDALVWLDGTTSSNLPTGAKRWNSTNAYFEKFDGSAWSPLTSKYMINVDMIDERTVNDGGDTINDLWTADKIKTQLSTKLNANVYTPTDVLNKLLTVDGAGSGLDADMLDGMNAVTTNTPTSIVMRDASGNFSANALTVTSVNSITGLSSTLPVVAGTATIGTSTTVARADHIHPSQTNISGNANTATYATTAGNANQLIGKNWNWSGQSGQPNWLWGGSDGTNMYVYNPSEFVVANLVAPSSGYKHVGVWGVDSIVATGAILVNSAYRAERCMNLGNHQWDSKGQNGYIRLSTGLVLQWGLTGGIGANSTAIINFPTSFPNGCLILEATKDTSDRSTADYAVNAWRIDSNQFGIANGANGTFAVYWFAIGY